GRQDGNGSSKGALPGLHHEIDRVAFLTARHATKQLLSGQDAKRRPAARCVEWALSSPLLAAGRQLHSLANYREQIDFFSELLKNRGRNELVLHAAPPVSPSCLHFAGRGRAAPSNGPNRARGAGDGRDRPA